MRIPMQLIVIGAIFQQVVLASSQQLLTSQTTSSAAYGLASLDRWLEAQEQIALDGVLANIGPNGSKVEGAAAGIVVASPSKSEPDCMPLTHPVEFFGSLDRDM